jgi:hypothetical protein
MTTHISQDIKLNKWSGGGLNFITIRKENLIDAPRLPICSEFSSQSSLGKIR